MKKIVSLLMAAVVLLSGAECFAVVKTTIEFFASKQRGWELQVDDGIVYYADGTAGVQIIDATDKEDLKLIHTIETDFDARIVEKCGDALYIVGGGQMLTYNVRNPEDAFLMKTDAVQANATRMNIDGNKLGVFGSGSATIFDVTEEEAPQQIAAVSIGVNSPSGYIKDDHVYCVGTNGVLYIYDISDLEDIKNVATKQLDNISYANDILVEGNYLYVADNAVLGILDVTDKTNPTIVSTVEEASRPNGLFLEGNKLYVGGYSIKAMVFDVSDVRNVVKEHDVTVQSQVYAVIKEGQYIYCACSGGMFIVDMNYQYDTTEIPPVLTESEVFGGQTETEEPAESIFDDTKGHWAESSIAKMNSLGYVAGAGNNQFLPEDHITRAEFVSIAARMATPAMERYKYRFEDVTADAWYADYIETAYVLGLIPEEMAADAAFKPDAYITREEMAAVTVKLMEYLGITSSAEEAFTFEDDGEIAEWAKPYVYEAYALGLISGMDETHFAPQDYSTRAQVCSILAAGYEMTLEEEAEFIAESKYDPAENTAVSFTEAYEPVKKDDAGYPVVIKVTDAVEPGALISFFGEYLGGAEVYIQEGVSYDAEPGEQAVQLEIAQTDAAAQSITCVMPEDIAPGVFTAYIRNSAGYSAPIAVNNARLTWVDRDVAEKNDIIRVNGRNFAQAEFGGTLKTGVALVNDEHTYNLELTAINPFQIKAYIGEEVASGDYEVYVTNDGERWNRCNETYGKITVKDEVYDPYGLNMPWADEFAWDNKIDITQAPYNADNTGVADMTEVIQKAIDDAHAAGGGVIYFPAGEYKHCGLLMDANVVFLGDGMEKSKLVYAYKGEDVASKQAIGTKDEGRLLGRIGFMNMGFFLDDSVDQGVPDTYFWLGENWGDNINNVSLRTAQYIFLKGCKLWAPMIRAEHASGRGLGVVVVCKSHTLFENNIYYGNQMTNTSNYTGKYAYVLNNYYTTATNNLSIITSHSVIEGNTMNRNWQFGAEVVNTQGVFMRGYSYVAENVIRNTGMPGGNDGELVCTEVYRAGERLSGNVVSATSNTITLDPYTNSEGEPLGSETAGWYLDAAYGDGWDIVITAGKGLGQRRRVLSLDEEAKTMTIEGEWDIIPDETSDFVFTIAAYSATIYNNYANTGAKGLWLYGDCYDCVISENNLVDTEGVFGYTCYKLDESQARINFSYFNRMSKNQSRGFSTKSRVNGIGVQTAYETPDPFNLIVYGYDIRDNLIIGGDDIPEAYGETEAPDINGIYAVVFARQEMNDNLTGMKGVNIENNRVEKMDRGISVGGAYDKDIANAGRNLSGTMTENIVLKGNTFSDVEHEVVDVENEATYVE